MGLRRKLRKAGALLGLKTSVGQPLPYSLLGYDDELAARKAILQVRDRTMIAYPALLSLWAQIRHCETTGISGAFVECGVWKGGVGGFMALANQEYGSQRRPIHLFDIFDDICEPDPAVDGERAMKEVEQFAKRDRATLTGKKQPLTGIYDHMGGPGDAEAVKAFVAHQIGHGDFDVAPSA